MLIDISEAIIAFILVFILGTLVEYWAHRLMHIFPQTFKFHTLHHIDGRGKGWLKEFLKYIIFGSPIWLTPLLVVWLTHISWIIAIFGALGGIGYGAFAAYAHQLQHDNPSGCEWMTMPTHYVHHRYNQWHHNFGLGVDWWDKIFGTYHLVNWYNPTEPEHQKKGYFKILWW